MQAWITFDPNLGWYSPITFWTVMISVVLTLGFTLVVFVGGLGDIRYLLRSLEEEPVDPTDDGTVTAPEKRT